MLLNTCVIYGRAYRFQHPGNREWMKLQSSMLNLTTKMYEMEKLFDYAFEHVVIPVEGNKINWEVDIPVRELEAWQIILPRFFRGELDTGYVYPDDKQSQREGAKLLQKIGKE